MTNTCQSISIEANYLEPFEDRIDILFHELELATKWQRPSVLLAIYSSEYVRADADIALENRLYHLGQSTYHIKIKNKESADVSLLISELADIGNVVFFVEGLRWGAGEDGCCAYHTLNKSREFFIENQVRVVFWLTEKEAIDLAHHAPDYWSFRHRVIEFVDSPTPEQISPHVLESAWQGMGEFTETTDDLDAKIALRTALLTDLPVGNESTSARANLLLTLGMLHWRRGDYDKAAQFLNTALDLAARLEDDRFEALCFNAIALVETDLGRFEEAILAYQNAISLAPERISPWNNLGNLYRKLERNVEALAAFQKAIEKDAADGVGWNGLGEVYHLLGRHDDAIYAFLKAIDLSPNYAHSWSGLGNSYLDEGRFDDALAAHQKAIEIDRRIVKSWLGLGNIYKKQGKNEEARTVYQTAIELDPQNAQAWSELGELYYNAGAYDEAMHTYRRVVEFDQGSSQLFSNLASMYVLKGHHTEAIPLLRKGIELSDDNTDTACLWNRLGDTYRRLNDYDNAIAAYRQADALDRETAPHQAGLSAAETEVQSAAAEATSPQPEEDLEDENLPEESYPPEVAEPGIACQPESALVANDMDTFPTRQDTEFMDWLDGLATVLPVSEQSGAVEPAASDPMDTANMERNEMSPQMQPLPAVEPKENDMEPDLLGFQAGGADLSDQDAISGSIDPSPEFQENYGYSVALMEDIPVNPELEEKAETEHPAAQPDQKEEAVSGQTSAENAHIWNELGTLYCNTGANDEAAHAFEKAIELDRSDASSYSNLASLYYHQGRYADAILLYQKELQFLEKAKDKAVLWNRMGDAYRRLDEHTKAAAAYRKAMDLDPENVSLLTRARFSLLGNCRA